jgi:hypothetical protein
MIDVNNNINMETIIDMISSFDGVIVVRAELPLFLLNFRIIG